MFSALYAIFAFVSLFGGGHSVQTPAPVESPIPSMHVAVPASPVTKAETTKRAASSTASIKDSTPPSSVPALAPAAAKAVIPAKVVPQPESKPAPVVVPAQIVPVQKAVAPQSCNPNYSGCLKTNAGDYDCIGGKGDGPNYTGKVQVIGNDEYGLDRDHDGWGCD